MISRHITRQRQGRRLITGLAALGLVATTLFSGGVVLATHTAGLFELDIVNGLGDANTKDDPPGEPDDWANVYAGDSHAFATTFKVDPVGSAENSFYTGGGSKDVRPIGDWAYGTTNDPVPDKDDIANLFAAAYTAEVSAGVTHTFMYFGIDRFDNSGDAETGFWFFKNPVTLDGNGGFIGEHATGDILVLADWGGSNPVGEITVYQWVGGKNPLALVADTSAADCATAGVDAKICAVVNRSTDNPPWDFTDKAGSADIRPLELFEAGIDLNELIGEDRCFSTILGATRSSHSTTAQLKDFSIDTFEQCGASMATQVSDSEFEIGGSVSDDATVTVSGGANPPAPTGNVAFSYTLNGGDPVAFGTKPLSGAVKVGSAYTVTSATFTPTAAGDYCFSASWAGDSNYTDGPYVDDGTNECFTVTPKQPTLTTQVNTETGVSPGTAIWDTATLGNTATPSNGVYGTITFKAYGPEDDATTCTAPAAYTSVITVTGNGDYLSKNGDGGAFAPTEPGHYNWTASYAPGTGDVNNLTKSVGCGAAHEGSIVLQYQPELTTAQTWTVKDSMTVTVAWGTLSGTAYFELYSNATCTGTPVFTDSETVSGASPQTVSTSTTVFTTSQAALYWKVWYDSGYSAHADIEPTCTENSVLSVDN